VTEQLDEAECWRLIGTEAIGRLAYNGRYGPMVLPVMHKVFDESIVFRTPASTFTEEDLRTGIADAEYQVVFETDRFDPDSYEGWTIRVLGAAHHVDTEDERTAIVNAVGIEPWPQGGLEHFIRIKPTRVGGRRVHQA
jgi:nitroimidazol reductase NimA-like FMN-containing flavoprotein (pyridoxamine 5'-phosphate oxidase superfamily)